MQSVKRLKLPERTVWLIIASLLVGARLGFPPRDLSSVGLIAIPDLALTLAIWVLLLFLHFVFGKTLLEKLLTAESEQALVSALSLPVGFGLSGSILGLLGIVGLLSKTVVFLFLGISVFLFAPGLTRTLKRSCFNPQKILFSRDQPRFNSYARFAVIMVMGLSFLNALVPAWSYDALMYHLTGPDQFLAAGRIFPQPDNWYINGPFIIEMLFTISLAMKDAMIAKLIHWTFGVSLLAVTYAFARRWFDEEMAWLSVIILVTIPIIPIISGFAYIDLAWATFEFGGLAALMMWSEKRSRTWLLISGLLLGLAISSKYLGLMGLATAGIFFLAAQIRSDPKTFLKDLAWFGVPVMLLGASWYLKNWITLGNPIYPLYFGGQGWHQTRLNLYMGYLNEFGTGRSFKDFILLPWNVYARHEEFGAVFNRNDIPSLLFPLTVTLVFLPKKNWVKMLIFLTLIRSAFWSIGSHQIRFLLPIYPMLSILTGYSIQQLVLRFKQVKLLGFFLRSLALALTFITVFYQIQVMRTFNTLAYTSGALSGTDFLANASRDFPAKDFLLNGDSLEGKVLLIGDGRSYYCQEVCIPDPDHFRWAYELSQRSSTSELEAWLVEREVGYLLLSKEDLGFLTAHDQHGLMGSALGVVERYRQAGCLRLAYADQNNTLYEVICH
ncbi:MAG: glycosyltransferase family 39 protein [Anaerolineales bacterium]|jgi:hypothetical protein